MGFWKGRNTALVLAAIVSMVVLTLAVLFANSYSTGQVTANARTLHATNSLMGASAILRAANNQAALFSRAAELGSADVEARGLAVAEAERTLETFINVAEQATTRIDVDIDDMVADLIVASNTAMASAGRGDYETAFEILGTDYEPTWQSLTVRLGEIQDATVATIEDTETVAGWVGLATRFLAILLLPTAAIFIYRRIARTQARERRLEFEAKLAYERELNVSKDSLLAGLAHQLRTPVTGIYGMSDLVADGNLSDPETVSEFISSIRAEAYDLDRMVADLLTTARLDAQAVSFKRETVDVARAVERTLAPLAKTGVECEVDLPLTYTVIADEDRIIHILRNLVCNADRHGGASIRIGADHTGDSVEIWVEDDGAVPIDESTLFAGFPKRDLRSLTTGKMGLGLNVAHRLAQGMGGDLRYIRSNDRTRFTLSLESTPTPVKRGVSTAVGART